MKEYRITHYRNWINAMRHAKRYAALTSPRHEAIVAEMERFKKLREGDESLK